MAPTVGNGWLTVYAISIRIWLMRLMLLVSDFEILTAIAQMCTQCKHHKMFTLRFGCMMSQRPEGPPRLPGVVVLLDLDVLLD